jgi:large subunit ribosomal protein L20
MVRIKSSVQSKKGKKKVLKKAKGYTGARSKRLRAAKEQVMHAGADAFTHRKDKKLMQLQGNMIYLIQNLSMD